MSDDYEDVAAAHGGKPERPQPPLLAGEIVGHARQVRAPPRPPPPSKGGHGISVELVAGLSSNSSPHHQKQQFAPPNYDNLFASAKMEDGGVCPFF